MEYFNSYIKNAKLNGAYAGDIEISTAAILFGCNIRIYVQDVGNFKLLNEFNEYDNFSQIDKDIVNILYINNNHFELLLKKDCVKNLLIHNIIKNIDIKNLYTNYNLIISK